MSDASSKFPLVTMIKRDAIPIPGFAPPGEILTFYGADGQEIAQGRIAYTQASVKLDEDNAPAQVLILLKVTPCAA